MKCSFADSERRLKAAGLAIIIHRRTRERNVMEFLHKVINKSWQGPYLKGTQFSPPHPIFWRLSRWMNCRGGRPQYRGRVRCLTEIGSGFKKEQWEAGTPTMAAHGPPNVLKANFKFIGSSSSLGIRFFFFFF